MRSTIYIDKDGNLSGLVDDRIDKLNALGPKKVERVSDVEFDHAEQLWVATDMQGNVIAKNPVRGLVIEDEREHFNRQLEQQFSLSQ
jgi:hypothetical protein